MKYAIHPIYVLTLWMLTIIVAVLCSCSSCSPTTKRVVHEGADKVLHCITEIVALGECHKEPTCIVTGAIALVACLARDYETPPDATPVPAGPVGLRLTCPTQDGNLVYVFHRYGANTQTLANY